ncbi:hypothetical protein ASD97_25985 [Streptomyces sp. Root63]|uniref:hypothetical protein n=1 Tax=unclassified Streptomyces TaxID=2593676 RepID=UPI0006F35C66|nr:MULTISPECIES: hypothetical protein [unclassified Streptomyces]KQX43526.1 hypothetical protein ASD29_32290 [Streptomyces sp. Root1295]KRA34089.1 hypothetical protein ASD97_25985 [Streptomyces sp. Root63]
MVLEDLIEMLESTDSNTVVKNGFNHPHSYRGFYRDLAFEPARNVRVEDMLADARSALGETFEGWKGGDYTMGRYTECWLSIEGESSGEILGRLLVTYMLGDVA